MCLCPVHTMSWSEHPVFRVYRTLSQPSNPNLTLSAQESALTSAHRAGGNRAWVLRAEQGLESHSFDLLP